MSYEETLKNILDNQARGKIVIIRDAAATKVAESMTGREALLLIAYVMEQSIEITTKPKGTVQ